MSLPRPGPASRLFCIGRNYAGHAREMNAECPVEPVVFLKPGSCLRRMGQPLELPAGEGEVHYEGELVLLLSGEARAPFAAAALGLDLTLRERQARLKAGGLPWETAKAFDGAAAVGRFRRLGSGRLEGLRFETWLNGRLNQRGGVGDMIFPPADLLAFIRRFWRLRAGDLLFTGTPAGVGPLSPGDRIELRGPGLATARWEIKRV
jgi:2-keto-4-pentenoate hydratase/2-oxohepta-3-ene-1,7-dioic acid hydratase in catechol pathway